MRRFSVFIMVMLAASAYVAAGQSMAVTVANPTFSDRKAQTIELPLKEVSSRLGSACYYVTSANGTEIPSQVTYDSLLVFKADVPAAGKTRFTVATDSRRHTYPDVCCGRVYPQRADDVAWENNLVGFRAYGPATQRRGEKAFGYDLFFIYPGEEPVVESLYEAQCSPRNWAVVDSLRKIDRQQAKEFENSFTYHIDHGKGMDCYAVGPTLGAGVAAPVFGDSIGFAWCYDKAEILDNGPVRFTVRLTFAPRTVASSDNVVETRIISLDRDSYLNRCSVTFNGLTQPVMLGCGFPLRDSSPAIMMSSPGIIAYADPTQGSDNGKALLGIIHPHGFSQTRKASGHVLGMSPLNPGDTFTYYWGFAWNRTGVPDLSTWTGNLLSTNDNIKNPLIITF